jgi:hypothetical protein
MADVDGDGKDDIVGFSCCGVYVAFSTGTGFETYVRLLDDLYLANVEG